MAKRRESLADFQKPVSGPRTSVSDSRKPANNSRKGGSGSLEGVHSKLQGLSGVRRCGNPPIGKSGAAMVASDSATPYHWEFQPEDLGKTAYWVITWTDGKTESSPSEPYGATITE